MFVGFLIGTLCLFGLVRVLTRRRWYGGFHHYGGHGYGYGGGPYGWGHGGPPWRGHGRGFLWSVLGRLDATPSQEKAILGALDELKDTARELRGTVRETRGDVARTVRGPEFDESAFQAASTRIDEATHKMRSAVAATLGKIHGVLDDRQRKILGEMIDSGWAAGC
jgi:Spy/CpxP family protein refolding chaperone